MKHCIDSMLNYANRLMVEQPNLDYITRTNIERCLFVTAKALVYDYLNYDLRNFTLSSHENIENLISELSPPQKVSQAIMSAFEFVGVLSSLSSGDPYEEWQITGEIFEGRTEAIHFFARRLRKYAEALPSIADS